MENREGMVKFPSLLTILIWAGLWGIFEATAGYLLHMLPFNIGWLVWYPVACFIMLNAYRKVRRTGTVLLVGLLSACIKLVNLFLPGRLDKVLNPAVCIVFEALAMAAVIFAAKHFSAKWKRSLWGKFIAILCMNTGWRLLYVLYLLFLVPDWMKEISVISSLEAFATFFLVYNLIVSVLLLAASFIMKYILRPINTLENAVSITLSFYSCKAATKIKAAVAIILIGSSIALEMLL